MCLSAEADFVAAAVVAPVGVATLRVVERPRDLLLASLPLLLALHQLTEGFVWLGLEGNVSVGLEDAATRAYLAFAQVVLPVLVPLAILLLHHRNDELRDRRQPGLGCDPRPQRRRQDRADHRRKDRTLPHADAADLAGT